MKLISDFWKRLISCLYKFATSEENHCRRCGVCHHVCQMIKTNNTVKAREE